MVRRPQNPNAYWVVHALVHEDDRAPSWLPWLGVARRALDEFESVNANGILVWSERTKAFAAGAPRFYDVVIEQDLVVLPVDRTPLDQRLSGLRQIEWTNNADIFWQWRVANGVPSDHVDRPKH